MTQTLAPPQTQTEYDPGQGGQGSGDKDLLDLFIEIGAGFDFIGPAWAILNDAIRGPHYVFMVPYDACPMSGREVGWYLDSYGIESWGYLVVSGELMFSVIEAHGKYAAFLLEQAGVPVSAIA